MHSQSNIQLERHLAPPLKRQLITPFFLLLVLAIPILGGIVSFFKFTFAASVNFDQRTILLLLHIVSMVGFCVLGAFQFVPAFRSRGSNWHRYSGRISVILGLIGALTGLWLTWVYSDPNKDVLLLVIARSIFGTAMFLMISLAIAAIYKLKFVEHQEWMTRAFAIAVGTGVQVFIFIPIAIVSGSVQGNIEALAMIVGWAVALVFAELILIKSMTPRSSKEMIYS